MKRTEVRLTEDEQLHLGRMIRGGVAGARKLGHARILLQADEGESHEGIAESVSVSNSTVTRVCQRYVREGLERALEHGKVSGKRPRKLDGRGEARLIAVACGEAPAGRARWTMRLLAGRLVELGVAESIAPETVRQTLKKINCRLT